METHYLVGDIGGTKSLFQLFSGGNIASKSYLNRDFANFDDVLKNLKEYFKLSDNSKLVISMAIAAPIIEKKILITNLNWELSKEKITEIFPSSKVYLMNDLEAVGEYIARSDTLRSLPVKPGSFKRPGNSFIAVGIGTGFGLALGQDKDKQDEFVHEDNILPIDITRKYTISATEAGHSGFSPTTNFEMRLNEHLIQHLGNVSIEDVCSSRGMINIYKFMTEGNHIEEPEHKRRILEQKDPVKEIIRHSKGREKCDICQYVVKNMVGILARKLQDLSLQYLPYQGIFLFGGIIANIMDYINSKEFVNIYKGIDIKQSEKFSSVGDNHVHNLKIILNKIPIYILTANDAAVQGAYHFALNQ